MTEIDDGIQTWESNETVPQIFGLSGAGVFAVFAQASKEGCLSASDITQFNIDPPAGASNNTNQILIIASVFLTATVLLVLASRYSRRKRTQKEAWSQQQEPQPETSSQKKKRRAVRARRVPQARMATHRKGRRVDRKR